LTGDAPHPAQRNAALEAYEYLIEKEKVPPSHIILAGDSAGGKFEFSPVFLRKESHNLTLLGHLAASVIHYMKDHPEIPRPGGTILISAWLDPSLENTLTSPFADIDYVYPGGSSAGAQYQARQFAGEGRDVADPEISLARDKDLKGVPPHLCIYGKVEVLEEHSRKWIENCKASGVDVIEYAPKGGIHIFPMGGFTADSRLEAESDEVVLNYIAKSVGFVEGSS
jgi:acetyl esterase/lipase